MFPKLALTMLVLAFTTAVSAVGFYKYDLLLYNGLDLAIFSNVLANLSQGSGWWSDIQQHSYIGDHFEPVLLFLIPLFKVWSDPRLLLIAQALVLGLTAVPVYLLVQQGSSQFKTLNSKQSQKREGASAQGVIASMRPRGRGNPGSLLSGVASSRTPRNDARKDGLLAMTERKNGVEISRGSSFFSLVIVALWLFNPLLWNAALFEFHALAFAPVLLLSAGYYFLRNRFWPCMAFLVLALFVREDVALIVAMFGVVALVLPHNAQVHQEAMSVSPLSFRGACDEKIHTLHMGKHHRCSLRGVRFLASLEMTGMGRRWSARVRSIARSVWMCVLSIVTNIWCRPHWVLVPIVMGALWFLFATRVIAAASPAGAYPFLVYYGWLGESFGEVLVNVIGHPLVVARHLLRIPNVDFVLGLFLPFLFLPLAAPGYLLLALPAAAQVLLSASGGSNIMVQMHYGLLFVPALVLAATCAFSSLFSPLPLGGGDQGGWGMRLTRWVPLPRRLAITLGIGTYVAAAVLLGPFPGIARAAIRGVPPELHAQANAVDALIAQLPDDAVVSASASVITQLSVRRGTTYLPNVALGQQQFAIGPYVLPESTSHILFVEQELRRGLYTSQRVVWSAVYAAEALARLQNILHARDFRVVMQRDGVLLLGRGSSGPLPKLDAPMRDSSRDTYYIIGPLRQVQPME